MYNLTRAHEQQIEQWNKDYAFDLLRLAISCSNMILLAVYRFFRSYQSCVISYHGAFKQFRKHDITSLMRMDSDTIIQWELDGFT
jgi:hypothetical protein